MEILNCPECGKRPKIIFDYGAYCNGYGAWYKIQCKSFLRKPHLKIEEGKANKEKCLEHAIKHWNEKVIRFGGR